MTAGAGPSGPVTPEPVVRDGDTAPVSTVDVGPVPERAATGAAARPSLLEQMGGVAGIVSSTIPVMIFVVANLLLDLGPAVIAALVAGLVVAALRIARKQPLQPAVSGLFGVGIAAFLAYRSGEARAFYLPGLIYSAVAGLAFLVSVLVRWPLAGVIWHGVNGDGQGWRRDRRLLRAYTWATLLWALVFLARLVVQGLLFRHDQETWLGIARLVMGSVATQVSQHADCPVLIVPTAAERSGS